MKVSKYRRWTKKEDQLLKKLYQKKTLYELGDIFNRGWNKVCRRAIKLGIKKDRIFMGKLIRRGQEIAIAQGKMNRKGNKNPNWKGGIRKLYGGIDSKTYYSIHNWLRKNFGEASKCENENCKKISNKFSWAKKSDCEYKKDRNNFMMLCWSCHKKYDLCQQ